MVIRPEDLFRLHDDAVAELDACPVQPILVYSLQGFVDAGNASGLAASHLLSELPNKPIVDFDADLLIDYRARRPRMSFQTDAFSSVDMPQLTMHLMRDSDDQIFLLLNGPEPDVMWDRFSQGLIRLSKAFNVHTAVAIHAIPWASPHTRPVSLTPHASDRSLISGRPRWVGDLDVPGSAASVVELRMGEAGIPSVGFTGHVPHYLANTEFPPTSVALLEAVSQTTGLQLPIQQLRDAGAKVLDDIDQQIADSDETLHAVRTLEAQYDASTEGNTVDGPGLLTPSLPEEELPGGDQLASDFQAYFRQLDEGKEGGSSPF